MKLDSLCLLLLIDSCHQVVTQLRDRVKVMWHVRKGFAVAREFRVGSSACNSAVFGLANC